MVNPLCLSHPTVLQSIITLNNIHFRFKNGEREVLNNVSFSVKRGECVVIMGPSGSGKSTLCHCLNGLVPQALEGDLRGNITVLTKDPRCFRVQTMSREIGLMMQDPEVQIVGRTVYEDVAFGPGSYLIPGDEIDIRIHKALKQVGLQGFEKRKTDGLSGGEKQRLVIAGLLAIKPDILVLDEPASELDPAGRKGLFQLLEKLKREEAITLIIVDKNPIDFVAFVDSIVILDRGEVVWHGDPRKLATVSPGTDFNLPPPLKNTFRQRTVSHSALKKQQPVSCAVSDVALEIKNLSFGYDRPGSVLNNINLKLYQDDYLALVGHNGAGKTSLAKHLNGLIVPDRGAVFFYGKDISKMSTKQRSQSVGYVFQNPDHQIFESSVEREIEYGLKFCEICRTDRARIVRTILEITGLTPYRHHHPYTLSKGIRQLIAIASIAALSPKVLVIDEPTTGLDHSGIGTIMTIIGRLYSQGTAMVLISHDLALIRHFTKRMVVLLNGEIIADDRTEKVFANTELMREAGLAPT
jgi:energy-coupling factor transport system ATP-binding protein